MLTLRNEHVSSVAASRQAFTNRAAIASFVARLPLSSFVVVEPVALALYGTKTLVVDDRALARRWIAANLGRGFEEALSLAEARVAACA